MNHLGGHRAHMGIMVGVAVAALLLGVGFGSALTLAFLACGLMMGVMMWMMMSSTRARNEMASPPNHDDQQLDSTALQTRGPSVGNTR